MRTKLLPKGGIYEVNLGYHSKRGGYTTLMSDIPKLSAIAALIGEEIINIYTQYREYNNAKK